MACYLAYTLNLIAREVTFASLKLESFNCFVLASAESFYASSCITNIIY